MTSLHNNRIIEKMLDRLFAALVNGPSLNARPHSSRQRIDLTQLSKFKDRPLEDVLKELLGDKHETKLTARVPLAKKRPSPNSATAHADADASEPKDDLSPEEKNAIQAYSDQQSVITKLRGIAEDAKSYENDTGVHVLQIGFPLLSLPPGSFGQRGFTRRILAPVCFIPISMSVKGGPLPSVTFECRDTGADLVVPNIALLAWLQTQAGKEIGELDPDESGSRPWDEIAQIVARVATTLGIPLPECFAAGATAETTLALRPCPRADADDNTPQILSSAIVGLFPLANQGLIRDMQALLAGEDASGPIESFVNVSMSLDAPKPAPNEAAPAPAPVTKEVRDFSQERLITQADPCQARAVKQARHSRGLVVHGPPGTGKSQTIANIIGDHLARGQRVLFVCDKRTALDVVMNRLEAMGLGNLCAIVHDPQRDQRDLYRAIREQLDTLADLRVDPSADVRIARLDAELQRLHGELTEHHTALMDKPDSRAMSFHGLMGAWLAIPSQGVQFKEAMLTGVSPEQIDAQTRTLDELFQRSVACTHSTNPWVAAAGISLANFLATPMNELRQNIQRQVDQSRATDETLDAAIPPFVAGEDVLAAANERATLAERLGHLDMFDLATLRKWAAMDPGTIQQHLQQLTDLSKQTEMIAQGSLDPELFATMRDSVARISELNQHIAAMDAYVQSTQSIFGFLAFGKKKAAAQILAPYGLALSKENAERVRDFLLRLKARLLIHDATQQLTGSVGGGLASDDELLANVRNHTDLFTMLASVNASVHLKPLREKLIAALASKETLAQLIQGLKLSNPRAHAIADLESSLKNSGLFSDRWIATISQDIREGKPIMEPLTSLQKQSGTIENVLRVREGLAQFPESLRNSVGALLAQSVSAPAGLNTLKKSSLSLEITERLRTDARLQTADSQRLQSTFDRYIALDAEKKTTTRQAAANLWGARQKERLLAGTGSRLNGAGADLRRRFTLRGERAMRLRQVIAVGQGLPDGDALFDLRPVWMASPETVAQIFARKALFDIIVFDEASQCRLEEALPVLLRGQRVVIAGDPQQLPPTRFFESAIAVSEDEQLDTDQQLFESQQGEIEDLLGAALNIEIEESYLDVHYRSRNSDLIQFSNIHFYNSRLQPIPGHPDNRSRYAPVTLYRADGLYKDRQNLAEAQKVCQIVRDLLKREQPPSIGVACFNISQRDLILDTLAEMSESDPEFGRTLAEAWKRKGNGSFEGLFVKNLENVQGDERDHMIISTTYGPDVSGKFYRRFGPVGRAGGGRRLNVLVTRARDEVHLVTSIPESEYRHLPPIPPGQSAGGPWLLFAYLAYAEQLGGEYEESRRILSQAHEDQTPTLNLRPTHYPSDFCKGLGRDLLDAQKTGTDVFWGNDGFCVDLALQHPKRPDDVTIGVLCDGTRFALAADPVEWDVFRTSILQSHGWKLHRLWTPHFFRDQRGGVDSIMKDVENFLATENEKTATRANSEADSK